jgi:hypothetical protein
MFRPCPVLKPAWVGGMHSFLDHANKTICINYVSYIGVLYGAGLRLNRCVRQEML